MGNFVSVQCGDALTGRCWNCIANKCLYVSNLEDNLVALQAAKVRLTELRNDVMRNLINQQRPQTEQPDQVAGWLSAVDDTVAQVSELLARGAQERENLCMAGYCSKHYTSSYKFGKFVSRCLNRVNALMEADFKQLVVNAPAKQLESDLRVLRNVKVDLQALKEDTQNMISLEEGPEKRVTKQVQVWLSRAEAFLAEADKLIENGPQELDKLRRGDISNYIFVGMVAQQIEDIVTLHSKGDFSQVVVEAYEKQLESNLQDLRNAKEDLQALKEDIQQRISLEKRALKQVIVWLSRAENLLAAADKLIEDGSEELNKLLRGDISCSVYVRRLAKHIEEIHSLHSKGDFSEVEAHVKQLESNLQDLRNAKEDLQALKEDIQQRISLEEGPKKRTLKQVIVWLSRAENLLAEADNLIEDGSEELNKLLRGDISCSVYVRRLAKHIEEIHSLHSKGDFSEVTAKAVSRRPVGRSHKPTVGTQEMLEEALSFLNEADVGIIGIYGMGGVGKTTLLTQIASIPSHLDVVIWVVVSKDMKLDNIQVSIWKQIQSLNDRWQQKTPQEKADDISEMLERKRFLLLLDDVWSRIDLEEIGVPLPTKQNGSKVVFTTRSFAVCKQMEATQTMKVKPLNLEEAWQLFEEKVGKMDADILPVAQKVAEECCGLPIALITIGRAMASRSTLEEWEHALKVLRRSVSNLQGKEDELYQDMEVSVFKRLKFSYDSLPNNRVQSCFLYIVLFPEDFKILKQDLVRYWVAEKFCGGHEGYGIVYTLIRQCLLEDAGEYVKLHDVVRDMAVWIACECEIGKYKFFTQAGAQLNQLPEVKEWEEAKKVSFMANSFTSIEGSPRCSDIVTLFLSHNAKLKSILEGFFEFMTRLTVLDLSHTQIKVLPLEIMNLQCLEFINLSHTKLEKLPIEMKRLTRLKYLNLEGTFCLEMIPVQLISNLLELQVLNMFKCGSPLYEDVENNVLSDGNSLISELMCLENLGELSMTVRSASFLHSICSNQKLLNSMHALHLTVIKGTRSLNISALSNAEQLNLLDIATNFDLEELAIKDREAPGGSLSNNLLIFSGLREVNVDANYSIRHMTWLIFAPQLTILRSRRNDNMEEIISEKKLGEHQARVEHLNLFAKLQVLDLYDMQKLKTICPVALSFPSLTQIEVRRCPALKKLPLHSKSAEGCNVVIKAGIAWWNKLTWEDDETEAAFSSCFQKI